MEWIELRFKEDAGTLTVADELVRGLLTGELWMFAAAGRMVRVESIVLDCTWPRNADGTVPKVITFLLWHNKALADQIEFYEA